MSPENNAAHPQPGEPPSLLQELERKTIEELERLIVYEKFGKISPGLLKQGVQTLWNTVSGLISDETQDIIGSIKAFPGYADFIRLKRCFVNERGDVVVVVWIAGTGKVVTQIKPVGRMGTVQVWEADPSVEIHPTLAAKSRFEQICEAVHKRPNTVELP